MDALPDEDLVRRLARGRAEALDELYRRHARRLWAFCAAAASPDCAEDLVHETFLRVIRSPGRFASSRASFRTWLFQIARNLCVDRARRRGRIGREEVPLAEAIADRRGDAEESAATRGVAETVRTCIGELESEDERQALVLYYLGGKVYREVAAIIGRSTSMAQKLVGLARERMKRCLARRGVEGWP